jgi:hypothetical protein
MSDKPVTWSQGIAVVGGAFGICCLGFLLLHGMILADKAEAAKNLRDAVLDRQAIIKSLNDDFREYQKQNNLDHKEIMAILLSIRKAQ